MIGEVLLSSVSFLDKPEIGRREGLERRQAGSWVYIIIWIFEQAKERESSAFLFDAAYGSSPRLPVTANLAFYRLKSPCLLRVKLKKRLPLKGSKASVYRVKSAAACRKMGHARGTCSCRA